MCESIEEIYRPGAQVYIATDWLVFNDIVGISDETTWHYSQELCKLIKRHGFSHLTLVRVMDAFGLTDGHMTMKEYLALVPQCRHSLLREHGKTEEEVRNMIETDSDTRSTYCGFVKFLETDLRYSEVARASKSGSQYRKVVKRVAINMMIRAESFTKLLQEKFPDFARLSIHQSSGAMKLSIPLIVQGSAEFPRTPWHSVVALSIDGSYSTMHLQDVRDTHRLITCEGQPYYYREKSGLWDWEKEIADFESQYPCGLLVRPRANQIQALSPANIANLRALSKIFKAKIQVMGFSNSADILIG